MSIFGDLIAELEGEREKLEEDALDLMRQKVGYDTGALHDSLTIERHPNYSLVGVDEDKLVNDPRNVEHKDYSLIHHDGHGGFWVYPKVAQALTWIGKDGNRAFDRKGHFIPSYPGNPFVAETFQILMNRRW